MGKIAFVFSGQGDQYPGMGKALYETYPAAAKVYDLCDQIRPGTSRQCFAGTEEELKETKHTQPCLFATELAGAAVCLEKGITPCAVAGFSLGEMAAAVTAGIFDLETGFQLVCRRGTLMQEAAERYDTFMAAVVRLTKEQVQEVCAAYEQVYPVNFNCPGQITVAGLSSKLQEFSEAVKKAGGKLIVLKVRGAFHSPFMKQAADAFEKELKAAKQQEKRIPIYSNVTGLPYTEDVTGLLARQISSPVQWEILIRNMIRDGIDTFLEIGPGKTLTNMIRKIDGSVKSINLTEELMEAGRC